MEITVRFLDSSLVVGMILLLVIPRASAQSCGPQGQTGSSVAIDAGTKRALIDSLIGIMREKYVFPKRTKEIAEALKRKLDGGAYDRIFKSDDFAQALTDDLRGFSDDLHFRVTIGSWSSDQSGTSLLPACLSPAAMKETNNGFRSVKHLRGNVGYIEMTSFADSEVGGSTAEAAMQFLAEVDALIIDVRSCPGGTSSMIELLAGYLVEPNTELHTLYIGATGQGKAVRATAPTAAKPRVSMPVLILTGPATASAAELFAFDLKYLGRAIIVGEKTMGAGHCAEIIPVVFPGFTLEFQLPVSRPVHPVTNEDLQGTGVEPDIVVAADQALAEAHQKALSLLASKKAKDPGERYALQWASMAVKAEYGMVRLSQKQLEEYAGTYGPRRIALKGTDLLYERDGNPTPYRLVPLDTDVFGLEGIDIFRLRFDRDSSGVITGLTGIYSNGDENTNPKDI